MPGFDTAEIGDPMNFSNQALSGEPSEECVRRMLLRDEAQAEAEMSAQFFAKENAEIIAMRRRRKIAIVGSASSSLHLVPYNDPDYEIWVLAWRIHDAKRATRLFEIHRRDLWKSCQGGTDEVLNAYVKMLQETKLPVYLLNQEPDIPSGIVYPMKECEEAIGADYFASSVGYMLALAILEHDRGQLIGEIGIWGVDLLCEDEWAYQRPNCEYLLGILKGKGAKIIVPAESAVLKMNHAYGREDAPGQGAITAEWIARRIAEYEQKHGKALEAHYSFDGAYQVTELLSKSPEQAGEGERAFLSELALTPEQRTFIGKRGQQFLQGRHGNQVALHNLDGALQDARYIKIMIEHHNRRGVIPG